MVFPRVCLSEPPFVTQPLVIDMADLIMTYGYAALLVGTFLEGETIVVLAGFAAHQGYMRFSLVIFFSFLGTFLGDQLFFHIGRRKGSPFLEKRKHWKARMQTVNRHLERHQTLLILGFRFVYGIRTVTPFAIGMSAVRTSRFFILNAVSAACWAAVFSSAGYLFGRVVTIWLDDLQRYEILVMAAVALLGVIIWMIHFFLGRKRGARSDKSFNIKE